MKTIKLFSMLLAAALMLTLTGTAQAADKKELQQRFESRFPQLQSAKSAGQIGETSEGLVEAVKGGLDGNLQKLVSEENSDRRALYALIAKETDATPEVVAQRAAARNFDRARAGEWLKRGGKWEQK